MSQSTTTNASPFGAVTYFNSSVNGTIVPNIRVGATTLYILRVDNTPNGGAASYLQLWNATTATVGTTQADMVVYCPQGVITELFLGQAGIAFTTALSMACTTTPHGSTNPGSAVTVYGLMS